MFNVINHISNKHVLIMGDFSYRGINWTDRTCDKNSEQFLDIVDDCFFASTCF